ncbi:MAG: hypothetical protein JWQ15_450 [Marmoricola sp.]|nr:hypothetical protein [Marmoricola sp.]
MATELNRTTSPAGAAEIEEVDEFDCYDYDCGSVMPGVLTDVDFPGGIRRCDTCEKFDGDLDAAQAAAELVGGTLWFQGAAYYRRDSGCSFLGWHVCARRLGSAPGVSITLGCVNLSGCAAFHIPTWSDPLGVRPPAYLPRNMQKPSLVQPWSQPGTSSSVPYFAPVGLGLDHTAVFPMFDPM